MKDEEIFTFIEDEEKSKNINQESIEENKLDNPFVTGLPNWDLEPLYEPIKRGNRE